MEKIQNYNMYTKEMDKSMEDKLFFIDKISAKNLIDFGCADGTLLKKIRDVDKTINLFGIDSNPNMIIKAQDNLNDALFFVNNVPNIGKILNNTALNLSSVIHEVYSYLNDEKINEFWNAVNNSGYEYIIIRDMISADYYGRSSIDDVNKIRIRKEYKEKLNEFERIWGSICERKNLVHFLLKYRYDDNWPREVRENYIPLTKEQLLEHINLSKYQILFNEEYTLPYIKEKVNDEFGINIKEHTHIKLILKSI